MWPTHDGLLRLSAVLEELMETKGGGRHSGGNLMWDPPTAEGRRLYSSWCGPDPPDHFSILIGYRSRHAPSFWGHDLSDFVVVLSDVRSS